LWLHPAVATRDCADCLVHLYDETTGEVVMGRDKVAPRKRDRSCPAPCRKDPLKGCPKGTAENPISLTPQNERAVIHYRECAAVGTFPDDPIVRRNAAIIRSIEQAVERSRQSELSEIITLLALRRG